MSVRQVAKRTFGNGRQNGWEPEGPWLSVESGRSVPWALANPLRVDDVDAPRRECTRRVGSESAFVGWSHSSFGGASIAGPALTRRLNIAETSDGAGGSGPGRFGSDSDPEGEGDGDGDDDGDVDDDDDDDAGRSRRRRAAAAEPAHVEVALGPDPDDPRAPRARVPIPALPVAARRAAGRENCALSGRSDGGFEASRSRHRVHPVGIRHRRGRTRAGDFVRGEAEAGRRRRVRHRGIARGD